MLQWSKSRSKRSGSDLSVKKPSISISATFLSSKWCFEHQTQRPKRHLLNKNFLPFQDGNHLFGAQTIEMSEITWWNENLKTFFLTKKKRWYGHQNRVLSVLQVIWAVKSCPNR